MWRSVLSFIFASRRGERGAGALIVVLGSTLALLLVGATVAGHARLEMRMSTADTVAAQSQLLVKGAFEEAAARARDASWPQPADVATNCVPEPPYADAPYPWVCTDVLPRQLGVVQGPEPPPTPPDPDTRTKYDQVPIRAKWRTSATADVQWVYGWILIDGAGQVSVRYNVAPCTFDPADYYSGMGTCKQGT